MVAAVRTRADQYGQTDGRRSVTWTSWFSSHAPAVLSASAKQLTSGRPTLWPVVKEVSVQGIAVRLNKYPAAAITPLRDVVGNAWNRIGADGPCGE